MMSLNSSINNTCFSSIFNPSDPYENYPDKKSYKESILVAASSSCVNT